MTTTKITTCRNRIFYSPSLRLKRAFASPLLRHTSLSSALFCICSRAASAAVLSAATFFAASMAFLSAASSALLPAASAAAFFAAPAMFFSSAFVVFSIIVAMILKQRVALKMRKENSFKQNDNPTNHPKTNAELPLSLSLLAHT
ncbi:hypothetical protein L596_015041 [Steinernema carpocapsae]|uniref:Transmembrane protein n=1 Tax=Steinernema carpocapsae TaxID=34508 RepID=A0A4U5NEM8_STECR|nr:hypothetical protein L596_015041 [Steinernema carpocapsae]